MAMSPSASPVSFSPRPAATRPRASPAPLGAGRVRPGAPELGKWWAPLVGWSGRANYIEVPAPLVVVEVEARRSSSFVGGLTEEKARQLRARMVETESFHDVMYHSAIASRLARSA